MITCHIHVDHPYDVRIGAGLLDRAGEFLAELFPGRRTVVVTDSHVAPLYLATVENALRAAGISFGSYIFPAGEASKNWEQLGAVLNALSENQLTRSDYVIALGGGVTGDMAGFAASVFLRGVPYVQIPTTLLAAVDSSVGGKTAVDLTSGKNQAGTFWQPSLVICDTDVLRALPDGIRVDGSAECLKYGVIGDPELFRGIAAGGLTTDPAPLVAACVSMKGKYVEEDEKDTGARQFLNLGHTFGHAIEAQSHFSVSHGQGVAMGMDLAARAARLYFPDSDCCAELEEALVKLGLPWRCPYTPEILMPWFSSDKKRRGNTITLVLPRSIGHCELCPVTLEEAGRLLTEAVRSQRQD